MDPSIGKYLRIGMTAKTTAYRIRISDNLDMTVPAARLSSVLNSILNASGGLLSIDIIPASALSRSMDMISSIVDNEQWSKEIKQRQGYRSELSRTGSSAKRLIRSIKQAVYSRPKDACPTDYAIVSNNNARRMAIAKIAERLLEQQRQQQDPEFDEIPQIPMPDTSDMNYQTIPLDDNGISQLAHIVSAEIAEHVTIKPLHGKYMVRQLIYEQAAAMRPFLTPMKVLAAIAMIVMLFFGDITTAALDGGLLLLLCLLHALSIDYSFADMTIYGTLQDDASTQDYSAYYRRQKIAETGTIVGVAVVLILLTIAIAADATTAGGLIDQLGTDFGLSGTGGGTTPSAFGSSDTW